MKSTIKFCPSLIILIQNETVNIVSLHFEFLKHYVNSVYSDAVSSILKLNLPAQFEPSQACLICLLSRKEYHRRLGNRRLKEEEWVRGKERNRGRENSSNPKLHLPTESPFPNVIKK